MEPWGQSTVCPWFLNMAETPISELFGCVRTQQSLMGPGGPHRYMSTHLRKLYKVNFRKMLHTVYKHEDQTTLRKPIFLDTFLSFFVRREKFSILEILNLSACEVSSTNTKKNETNVLCHVSRITCHVSLVTSH